jgi:hypothetical protein
MLNSKILLEMKRSKNAQPRPKPSIYSKMNTMQIRRLHLKTFILLIGDEKAENNFTKGLTM